jgi:dephospho-CoA kinase
MNVVCIVGMAGSGKSEVARVFEDAGYKRVRFGDVTDEEISKRGLVLNEDNERRIREELRKEHGMAAYAKLIIPKIDARLKTDHVVADGLYSWEEYILFREVYRERLKLVAVWASPPTRYKRLATRAVRPLTAEQAVGRDRAEIENINKGGPIAMADFTIVNEATLAELTKQASNIVELIG